MKRTEAEDLLLKLAHAFQRNAIPGEELDIYYRALADLTYSEGQAAVMKCIQTKSYFPKVAEIRKAAGKTVSGDLAEAGDPGTPNAGAYSNQVSDEQLASTILAFWDDYTAEPLWAMNPQTGKIELGYHHPRWAVSYYLRQGQELPEKVLAWAKKEGVLDAEPDHSDWPSHP